MGYEKGQIYKLVNDVDGKEYVGSTIQSLPKRFYKHKVDTKSSRAMVYRHLRKVGIENVHIILIEQYPCTCKAELLARERYHYDQVDPLLRLNTYRPLIIPADQVEEARIKRIVFLRPRIDVLLYLKLDIENTPLCDLSDAYEKELMRRVRISMKKSQLTCQCGEVLEHERWKNSHRHYNAAWVAHDKWLETHCVCECEGYFAPGCESEHYKSSSHVFWETTHEFIYS